MTLLHVLVTHTTYGSNGCLGSPNAYLTHQSMPSHIYDSPSSFGAWPVVLLCALLPVLPACLSVPAKYTGKALSKHVLLHAKCGMDDGCSRSQYSISAVMTHTWYSRSAASATASSSILFCRMTSRRLACHTACLVCIETLRVQHS